MAKNARNNKGQPIIYVFGSNPQRMKDYALGMRERHYAAYTRSVNAYVEGDIEANASEIHFVDDSPGNQKIRDAYEGRGVRFTNAYESDDEYMEQRKAKVAEDEETAEAEAESGESRSKMQARAGVQGGGFSQAAEDRRRDESLIETRLRNHAALADAIGPNIGESEAGRAATTYAPDTQETIAALGAEPDDDDPNVDERTRRARRRMRGAAGQPGRFAAAAAARAVIDKRKAGETPDKALSEDERVDMPGESQTDKGLPGGSEGLSGSGGGRTTSGTGSEGGSTGSAEGRR
jgi:hypothetical protein